MFRPKFKFTYDEVRIIVMALVELKNQLIAEGRYTDAVDDLLIKLFTSSYVTLNKKIIIPAIYIIYPWISGHVYLQ